MTNIEIRRAVEAELCKARLKWPNYYNDVIHAVGLICEESGEAMQEALDLTYDDGAIGALKDEIIQTAAMCFRALENIDDLKTYTHKI